MRYLSFTGRLGRGGYIAALFVAAIISAGVFTALWFFEILDEESARRIGYLTAVLLMICPSVQRLHDTDHSGAGLLIAFIPIIHIGLGLYLLLKPGTPGANQYGSFSGQTNWNAADLPKEDKLSGLPEETEARGVDDDAFYDEVAKEIQENRMVPGVWTRAFAEADGDEKRAKAIYIKRRVAQLIGDRELNI